MPQSILEILQEMGALAIDKQPMKQREYDLTGGVPIIDIPRARGLEVGVVIYDNVTSPNGIILVQGPGNAYYGIVADEKLRFEVRKIEENHFFGVIGQYPDDYFTANRLFVDDLKSKQ